MLREKLLVLVHPGSACGSADCNLGRHKGIQSRLMLMQDLRNWTGGLLIVDGELSDELPSYPELSHEVEALLARASSNGLVNMRVWGCDNIPPFHEHAVASLIGKSLQNKNPFLPEHYEISLTGAWYDPEGSWGCVNAVRDVLADAGFSTTVMPNALVLDEDFDGGRQPPLRDSGEADVLRRLWL